jgi:hypothetical protein
MIDSGSSGKLEKQEETPGHPIPGTGSLELPLEVNATGEDVV